MRINELVMPKAKEKAFEIVDFSDYTDFCPNLLIGEEIKVVNQKVAFLRYLPSTTRSVYFINDKIYTYSSDKYVNEYVDYKTVKIDACQSKPILVSVMVDGIEEIIVISAESAFVLGKSEKQYSIPFGEFAVIFDNRLVIAGGTNLFIGGEFDVANLSTNLTKFSQINMPSQEANVLAVVPYDDSLVVFFQKAIYILKVSYANDFSLTKINSVLLDVKPKSIAKVGNEIFFISKNKMHVYKNGKIEKLTLLFDSYLSGTTKTAMPNNEYYLIPFVLSNKNYAFMFNTQNRKVHILSDFAGEFFGGKYLYDANKYALSQINEAIPTSATWTGLYIGFGTNKNKVITSVSIRSNQNILLYIDSEKGREWFQVNVGSNYRKVSLHGKEFRFLISPLHNKDYIIKDLKITYKILGE